MDIRFFFEYQNQILQLPVNPEELEVETSGSNKTLEIVKLGEVNQLRERKLKTLKIESFLPQREDFPFVLTKGKFEPPSAYLEFFNRIRTNKQPMRLVITGIDINMLVSIESFTEHYKPGDDDVWFYLELKEYRSATAKQVTISVTPSPDEPVTITTTPTREPKGFAIDDVVVVNGKYWYSSYGASPFGTFSNFTGKISHIVADTTRKYRYHIKTLSGSSRGWVAADQMAHK